MTTYLFNCVMKLYIEEDGFVEVLSCVRASTVMGLKASQSVFLLMWRREEGDRREFGSYFSTKLDVEGYVFVGPNKSVRKKE